MPELMKNIGLNYDLIENDTPINMQFSLNDFESNHFLKNIGSTLLFLIFYVTAWLFLLLTKIISSFLP